jgi:phage gp36-like protein
MPTITPYTTRTKLDQRLSQIGVDLRIDDDVSTADETIEEATVEVQGYLLRLYSDAQLQQSNWVQLKTTDIAAWMLCGRRGNDVPDSVQQRYEKAIADLERVQSGAVTLPDAAMTKAAAPTLSNQRVRLWPVPNIVNTPHNSTGDSQGYTKNDDRSDYNPNP